MSDLTHGRGINFRELNDSKIGVGIHREQFIEFLTSLNPDEKGWLNFDMIKNQNPTQKNGYSHFLKVAHIKPRR